MDGRNVQRVMGKLIDPYSKCCSEQTMWYALFLKKLCNIKVICVTVGKRTTAEAALVAEILSATQTQWKMSA